MSGLRVVARRSREPAEVGERGRLRLQGERQWLVEGDPSDLQVLTKGAGPFAERISDGVVLLRFGNCVGTFALPGLGSVDVVSGKWSENDFESMLEEVTTVAASLPFRARSSGSLPWERDHVASAPVLFHLFAYLRWALLSDENADEALLPSLRTIVADPHHVVLEARRAVRLDQARRVAVEELVAIAAGRRDLALARGTSASSPLARALRGTVPRRVEETVLERTVDTPENRFVLHVLRTISWIFDRVEGELARDDFFGQRLKDEVFEMRRRLRPIASAQLWSSVGRMKVVPTGSTVLQRRRGYRALHSAWIRLRLATRLPIDDRSLRRLLEVRDLADLYEIWCYFRMVEAVTSILGKPRSASSPKAGAEGIEIERNFVVRWGDGVALHYNRTYSRSRQDRRSFSVPLRPDVVLQIDRQQRDLHLFDAKFRLRWVETPRSVEGERHEVDREKMRRVHQREDLYKMHAYRDAIVDARSASVLYPGSEARFFPASPSRVTVGVGVFPLLPGRELDASLDNHLREVLRTS